MSEEIFDQQRPRSTMAKRLDEAFAGCEEWTTAPPIQAAQDAGPGAVALGAARG